jgi:hypothetical protein
MPLICFAQGGGYKIGGGGTVGHAKIINNNAVQQNHKNREAWKELIMRYVAFSTNNLVSFNFIRCIDYERARSMIGDFIEHFPFVIVAGLNLP